MFSLKRVARGLCLFIEIKPNKHRNLNQGLEFCCDSQGFLFAEMSVNLVEDISEIHQVLLDEPFWQELEISVAGC